MDNVSAGTLTPPPRRQSDLFTVDQTDTVVPTSTGGSTIILSPQLAASKPHLEVFNLHHLCQNLYGLEDDGHHNTHYAHVAIV